MTGVPITGPIRTVLGDIPAAALGRTLIHEHLISSLVVYWLPDAAPDLATVQVTLGSLNKVRLHAFSVRDNLVLDNIDQAATELSLFRAVGGSAVVDVTSLGIGRDIRATQMVSHKSGVHVVAGCGYYIGSTHPRGLADRSEESLADEMIEELTVGIDGTGIRAGILGELGVGSFPMIASERLVLRAAARAQLATGAAIVVHPAPGTDSAFEIVRVLDRAGARLDKVIMSHVEERFRDDRALYRRMARTGVRFGFDTFGREIYYDGRLRQHPSDTQRIEVLTDLIGLGLGEHITLAQDICLKHELAGFGGQGYAHVLENIVPRMILAGIPEAAIEQMLVETPARLLALDR